MHGYDGHEAYQISAVVSFQSVLSMKDLASSFSLAPDEKVAGGRYPSLSEVTGMLQTIIRKAVHSYQYEQFLAMTLCPALIK